MSPRRIPERLQAWIDGRTRHHLSHAQVQMARELGMNPTKLGQLDNHRQEPWKVPLPQFIEHLYLTRFGTRRPESFFIDYSRDGRGWPLTKAPSRAVSF
jgi:hypothetical protein